MTTADWRTRRFVPDSDDEDEEELSGYIDNNAVSHGSLRASNLAVVKELLNQNQGSSPVIASSSTALNSSPPCFTLDRDDFRDELLPGDLDLQKNGDPTSAQSSALSSLSSTPLSLSPVVSPFHTATRDHGPIPQIVDLGSPMHGVGVEYEYRPTRRFRERKAIQLKPYEIEGQRYKQALKSRGVVPVQVKNHSQLDSDKDADVSSSEVGEDSQSSDERVESRRRNDSPTLLDINEDEFPDLQSVLRPNTKHVQTQGVKRRKLIHTYSKKARRLSETIRPSMDFSVREDGWIEVPFAEGKGPSRPSTSHGEKRSTTSVTGKRLRQHAGLLSPLKTSPLVATNSPLSPVDVRQTLLSDSSISPHQLETPTTSSQPRPNQRDLAKRLETHNQPTKLDAILVLSDFEATSSDESQGSIDQDKDEEEANRQLVKAQRRTRGVLPASWHRLEYQKLLHSGAQKVPKPPQSTRRRSTHTSPVKEIRKGVAKRIHKGKSLHQLHAHHVPTPIVFDLDTEEDDEIVTNGSPSRQYQRQINEYLTNEHETTFSDDSDESNMEDNSIDIMIAASKTHKHERGQVKRSRKSNKAQSIHRDPAATKSKSKGFLDGRSSKAKQHVSKRSSNTIVNHKPRVGILDSTRTLSRGDTPNFIAFAARAARQRVDQGRHPVNHKHIILQNAKETAEAQQLMDDVVRNSSISGPTTTGDTRKPLQERSVNFSRSQMFQLEDDSDCSRTRDSIDQVSHAYQTMSAIQNLQRREEPLSHAVKPSVHREPAQKKGHPVVSKIRPSYDVAPAQLESESTKRRLGRGTQRDRKLVLTRFLQTSVDGARASLASNVPLSGLSRRPELRKRQPRQLSIAPSLDSENGAIFNNNAESVGDGPIALSEDSSTTTLKDLLPYGVDYPITFSVDKLPDGPLFTRETLVGSGLFSESLATNQNDGSYGPYVATLNGRSICWHGWNEAVAQQIFELCDNAAALIPGSEHIYSSSAQDTANTGGNLTILIRYLSKHLKFMDPVDVRYFARQWLVKLEQYSEQLSTTIGGSGNHELLTRFASQLMIIANQVRQLVNNGMVETTTKQSISKVSLSLLHHTTRVLFNDGFEDFRTFSKDTVNLLHHASRQKSSRKIQIFVMIIHILRTRNEPKHTVWDVLRQQNLLSCPKDPTFPQLDAVWKRMFSLLPLLEISESGKITKDATQAVAISNWSLTKSLIEPVFKTYSVDGAKSTINLYCRSVYARCFRLLDYWSWYDSESILGFLFDFFAQNDLRDLRLERSHGSPPFLSHLTGSTSLNIQPSDRCFHILLKFVGKSLRVMRSRYSGKKISNLVWRLTPNHDRSLPKDQAIRQEALDAVRNHLDLLSVLYWAAPPDQRIRVEVIQRLINLEDAHQEVCYIVLRTWSNLICFQLSTPEPSERLEPFLQWFNEIVNTAAKLYRLARSEVEADANKAQISFGQSIPKDVQERIILKSQRHAEAILFDALASLKNSIAQTENVVNLRKMLPSCLKVPLELFDVTQPRMRRNIIQLLEVFETWTTRAQQLENAEDSQGYGDWSGFDELDPEIEIPKCLTVPEDLIRSFYSFVSTIFGADVPVEDILLQKAIDCWLEILSLDVKAGYANWDDLVDPYSQRSWTALRETTQTRRYNPLIITRVIKYDPKIYMDKKITLLQHWVSSLVERESLIKFQGDLTSVLLNQDNAEPLFQNLPFIRDAGTYDITLSDFIANRLSLISCILSNMRESLSFSIYHQLPDRQEKRKNYTDLLRHLMNTMRSNYERLGEGPDLRGEYVSLIQRTVQLMEEHTTDIVKVDSFFTDATNFPLPKDDPEYLVAKLKSLAVQLQAEENVNRLPAFINSLIERSIIERKQSHYASLLAIAMEEAFENGQAGRTTLRTFVLCDILPVYLSMISRSPCGWIMADPLLLSVPSALQSLLTRVDAVQDSSMRALQSSTVTLLSSIKDSMVDIVSCEPLHQHWQLSTLTKYFGIFEASIDVSDYLCRCFPDQQRSLIDLVLYFAQCVPYIFWDLQSNHTDIDPPVAPNCHNAAQVTRTRVAETQRSFIRETLNNSIMPGALSRKWRFENDKLYVLRAGRWENIELDLEDSEQLQQGLMVAGTLFLRKLKTTPSFSWIVKGFELEEETEKPHQRCILDEMDACYVY